MTRSSPEQQAQLQKRLERLMRTNTFDPATQTITVDPVRAKAFEANLRHYSDVFGNGNTDYAIPKGRRATPKNSGSWLPSSSGPPGRRPRTVPEPTFPTRATGLMSRWSAIGPPARPLSGPA